MTTVLSNIKTPYVYWVLVNPLNGSAQGPTAMLDAVQFIPIPPAGGDDFGITISSSGTDRYVSVRWNALTYSRFHLEYSTNGPSGPWLTNTAPVTVSDYVADLTFTNSLIAQKFFRMAHN